MSPSVVLVQITHEFERFSTYVKDINIHPIFGGVPASQQKTLINSKYPHIVVGCPGRVKQVSNCITQRLVTCEIRIEM